MPKNGEVITNDYLIQNNESISLLVEDVFNAIVQLGFQAEKLVDHPNIA